MSWIDTSIKAATSMQNIFSKWSMQISTVPYFYSTASEAVLHERHLEQL